MARRGSLRRQVNGLCLTSRPAARFRRQCVVRDPSTVFVVFQLFSNTPTWSHPYRAPIHPHIHPHSSSRSRLYVQPTRASMQPHTHTPSHPHLTSPHPLAGWPTKTPTTTIYTEGTTATPSRSRPYLTLIPSPSHPHSRAYAEHKAHDLLPVVQFTQRTLVRQRLTTRLHFHSPTSNTPHTLLTPTHRSVLAPVEK